MKHLFESVFRIKHNCVFGQISERFPSLRIFLWYNPDREIIEIVAKRRMSFLAIIEEFSKHVKIVEKQQEGTMVHLVTTRYGWTSENSVTKNIQDFNLLQIPPEVYQEGWENYHVIAFSHEDLQRFFHFIGEKGFKVELLSKSVFSGFVGNTLAVTANTLFSGLTQKQTEALLASYDRGYYRIPRKANLTDIAKNRRVPRTTFEDHLRKAEGKLMTSLMPYLRLFAQETTEKK